MNPAHLHLVLTHLPIAGTVIGILILAYALLFRKSEAARISLGVFVLSGLAVGALYLTGEAAEEVVEGVPGISEAIIERHEEAAVFALVTSALLGLIALAELVIFRRGVPRWIMAATLVVALGVSGVMAWTANLGGQINHPEIQSSQTIGLVGEVDENGEADENGNDDN